MERVVSEFRKPLAFLSIIHWNNCSWVYDTFIKLVLISSCLLILLVCILFFISLNESWAHRITINMSLLVLLYSFYLALKILFKILPTANRANASEERFASHFSWLQGSDSGIYYIHTIAVICKFHVFWVCLKCFHHKGTWYYLIFLKMMLLPSKRYYFCEK